MCGCVYICVCVYVCMCVYIYTYIYCVYALSNALPVLSYRWP